MIPLAQAVDDYLAMRRALGYKLIEHGRVLPQFTEFLAQRGESLITIELALEFATQPAQATVVWWHQRLAIVRGFARYLRAFDTRHEVPPTSLLPAKFRRAIPYLFSETEIEALMHVARSMRGPLRAATCEAVIGLLAVTGMRVSEACALTAATWSWARADSPCAAARTAAHARSHFTRAPSKRSSAMPARAISCAPIPTTPPRSFSPAGEDDQVGTMCGGGLTSSAARPAWTAKRSDIKPVCTTSAIRSFCARCWAGIARPTTSRRSCRCSPWCWATSTRPTPTGTSRAHRSYSRWPPTGSSGPGSSRPVQHP